MKLEASIEKGLKTRWEELHSRKTTMLTHCEQYAEWTLPYIFPRTTTTQNDELPVTKDSLGARGVNHLSNKVVSTLFPAKQLFFRLVIDQGMQDLMEAALVGGVPDDEAKAQLEQAKLQANALLIKAEKRAEEYLDMVQYRPQAILAVKHLIITGNAMIYHPEPNRDTGRASSTVVYGLRDFHVVRDCAGEPVEMMTRETKAFSTFNAAVQSQLREDAAWHARAKAEKAKDYNEHTEVTIYTHILLEDDGLWTVRQYADDVRLDTNVRYTTQRLRWIPLVWNLVQGEDYGRGLVQDYAGSFHNINVMTDSLMNITAIMGDIKFFVDPQSMIDIANLNNSPPGSYHAGNPEHIGTAKMQLVDRGQFLEALIERFEKQISQAFMLGSAGQRNAERVTAVEIQRDAEELETSNSGVYSRLSASWQTREAYIALEDTGFFELGDGIEPRIITGMDSLSRQGEAQNMRLFLADLAGLNTVPELFQMAIKPEKFLEQLGQFHSVDYQAWVKTPAEMAAEQQARMQAEQQQMQAQANAQGQAAAAKEMATQE